MNKKGVFGISGEFILVLVIFIVVLLTLYFGIWKKAEGIAKEKLPAGEKLKLLIDKFTTSPGEAEIQRQGDQTKDIADAIKATINKMNDMDCIEQIDFSGVNDKDFTLEFKEENGKSNLRAYKIVNNQPSYIFYYDFNTVVYYFTTGIGTYIINVGSPTPLDRINQFNLINTLEKVKFFETKEEEISSYLYKDTEGNVGFFNEKLFDSGLKNKKICSTSEKKSEDPVLVRLDYFVPIFHKRLEKDKDQIRKWSEITGVPQEAILSSILTEDVRADNIGIEEKIFNLKSYTRTIIPDYILNKFGHIRNPEEGESTYGYIHCETFYGAVTYLLTLEDLDLNLKQALIDIVKKHDSYINNYKIEGEIGEICADNIGYSNEVTSRISLIAITHKAQMEYWKRAGFDILNYKFKTLNTFGDRIGLLITLNVLYAPRAQFFKSDSHLELLWGASYLGIFGDEINMERLEVPYDSPKLGGTVLWKGRDVSFGELAKIYVDNEYAGKYLRLYK